MSPSLSSSSFRQAPVVAVDARMWRSSGIGRYLREVLPRVTKLWPEAKWRVFGAEPDLMAEELPGVDRREWATPIYGWREHTYATPEGWAGADLRWVPHYNVTAGTRGPLVVTVHDVLPLVETRGWRGRLRAALARVYFRRVRRRATVVLCPSRFTAETAGERAGLVSRRVRVTPLGVDRRFFEVMPQRREPLWLFVGNVKRHKGLSTLLEAMTRLGAECGQTLVIVGRREGFFTGAPEMVARAEKLGDRVLWTGEVSEEALLSWYARAEALVMPSTYEGFGLPVLEAMAAGCPVVAARAASLPEVGGDAASWFEPGDVAGLAERLHELADSPERREELARAGRARAAAFSWDRTARLTVEGLHEAWKEAGR